MQRLHAALFLGSMILATSSLAQEPPQTSETTADEATKGYLKDDILTLKPAIGLIAYNDNTETSTNRFAIGLLFDGSFTSALTEDMRWLYLGITTGGIFSHLGSASSNFFGTSPDSITSSPGANVLVIPLNVAVGWNTPRGNARIALHGGGNVIYRSNAPSIDLGNSSSLSGPVWNLYPNMGIDLDVAVTKNVSLSFRPDFTFTPGDSFFTGTLSTGISLG